MSEKVGLPPLEPPLARVLVLGTLPGDESLARGQYYARKGNRFWPMIELLFGIPAGLDYSARCTKLLEHGVALWDVLRSAHREGSADATLDVTRSTPNDIAGFLDRHRSIEVILFNGQKAESYFEECLRRTLPANRAVRCFPMPGTSGANARESLEGLCRVWGEHLRPSSTSDAGPKEDARNGVEEDSRDSEKEARDFASRQAVVTPTATSLAREFWRLMATNDFASVAAVLSDDFVAEWPQSRERIRGVENYVRINTEYPANGPWRFEVHRVVGSENEAVTDVRFTDGVQTARAISFFTVANGRITRMVEYFPDSYEPPANRAHLVERTE